MVFLNNPENIEVTVDKLNYHGIKAAGIYGQAEQAGAQKTPWWASVKGVSMSSLPPISGSRRIWY